MDFDKYTGMVKSEASALTQEESVAICLICCARLSPLYEKFTALESWGDATVLSRSRIAALRWFKGAQIESNSLLEQLNEVVPDTENFGSVLSSYALNAGVAHVHLVEQTQTRSHNPVTYALQNCYETIDFIVQDILDPEGKGGVSEEELPKHRRLIAEVEWQLSVINDVQDQSDLARFVSERGGKPSIFVE